MAWFVGCLGRAIDHARTTLAHVLAKAGFWESAATVTIHERQRLVLNRLLDGFEGKLTTSKYARLANCSQDTAPCETFFIWLSTGLMIRGTEGGRSTGYTLAMSAPNRLP